MAAATGTPGWPTVAIMFVARAVHGQEPWKTPDTGGEALEPPGSVVAACGPRLDPSSPHRTQQQYNVPSQTSPSCGHDRNSGVTIRGVFSDLFAGGQRMRFRKHVLDRFGDYQCPRAPPERRGASQIVITTARPGRVGARWEG